MKVIRPAKLNEMRSKISYTAVLLFLAASLGAQAPRENVLLLTDRGHYITGETIYYRAFYQGPVESEEADWSKILYVELIMPNGTQQAQSKVALDSGGFSGSLIIPEGIASGTYYLKAYTRWMRNCGQENYAYTSVRIYDPFIESVLPEDTTGWKASRPEALLAPGSRQPDDLLECNLNESRISSRQEVSAELQWKDPQSTADLTFSVCRTGLHGNQEYFRPGCESGASSTATFLPETKGLTLSGRAVSAGNQTQAPYATIYVSVLGENREFFCNYSDSSGRFYFSFPDYSGFKDLFVSTYHPDYGDLELLIDRDFSSDVPDLPSYPVEINDSLSMVVTEMSVNAQISKQYYPEAPVENESDSAEGMMFYGTPSATVDFDDFIRLPTLEEYFIEVVPQVAVRKSRGQTRLVVLGPHHDLTIYPPLVMIDGVAIFDIGAILAVSPRLIDRIEIVNAPYIRGNVTFGGIISLISKNNDLGYIDLPSSGLLVQYQMLDERVEPSPEGPGLPSRFPDVRNTLSWDPEIKIRPGENRSIHFQTADQEGEYEILIRGIDSTGRYLEKRIPFRVE